MPEKGRNYSWTVKLNMEVDENSVTKDSVYILNDKNNKVNPIRPSVENKDGKGFITLETEGKDAFEYGESYTIVIEKTIRSKSGKTLKKGIKARFTVEEDPSAKFAGGRGTISDPYKVSTASQLNNVRNYLDKHFIQIDNINLDVVPWNEGLGWQPIGDESSDFLGTYDGNGKKIMGLTISRSADCQALFGHTNTKSKLRDIGLVNVEVSGRELTATLVGKNFGNIDKCYATGLVDTPFRSGSGGLVGENLGIINKSYALVSLNGKNLIGGLVGRNKGFINDSYAAIGKVKASGIFIGGLVGENTPEGTINNSYAAGLVIGGSQGNVSGLVGQNRGTIDKSYYDKDTTEQNDTGKGEGKTTEEMTKRITFSGWDFTSTWSIDTNPKSYPYLKWQIDNTPYPPAEFAGGTGTVEDPYKVSNAQQLKNIENHREKHFIQAADIDLGIAPWNTGEGWEIFDTSGYIFEGSYNGKGYKIAGLTINSSRNYPTLFGRTSSSAKISNIGLVDVKINGANGVASLVSLNRGSIDNCYATGLVKGSGSNIGGLVATNIGIVKNSFSTCSVTGNSRVGGLVGLSNGGTINNSYAAGLVKGESFIGGLVGYNQSGTVNNSYYDTDTSEQNDSGKGEGKTTLEMSKKATFKGWDFFNDWSIKTSPGSYPYLKWQTDNIPYPPADFAGGRGIAGDPYQVSNVRELDNVRKHLDKHFKQIAHIDLSNTRWVVGEGWEPIGPNFKGNYNGDGFKISGLKIDRPEGNDQGLFGSLWAGGELKNINLKDVNIISASEVGGLVGMAYGGIIDHCTSTGSVRGKNTVGGLVGSSQAGQLIESSYSTCRVTGIWTGDYKANSLGGLVGYSINGIIRTSFAKGDVGLPNAGMYVGGLVGRNAGLINDSYVTGKIAGVKSLGGLVGEKREGGRIENSYAIGKVNEARDKHQAGIVGYNDGEVINCYYDKETTGRDDKGKGDPKETIEMMNPDTFKDWDFKNIWDIEVFSSYPYLRWQRTENIPYPIF